MPKTKSGEKISWKEFMKRWKQGIEGITPLQQTKTSLFGMYIMLAGILWGVVVTLFGKVYWLSTILFGSLILILIQFVGQLQKLYRIKKINKLVEESKKNV